KARALHRRTPVNYRRLGSTGLKVSEIALGSWTTYGGSVDQDSATRIVHRAFELGINFFDTADVYVRGAAETVLGTAIASLPRGRDPEGARLGPVRVEPAALQPGRPPHRRRAPGLPSPERDRADRVLAARAGRAHEQVRRRCHPRGQPRRRQVRALPHLREGA